MNYSNYVNDPFYSNLKKYTYAFLSVAILAIATYAVSIQINRFYLELTGQTHFYGSVAAATSPTQELASNDVKGATATSLTTSSSFGQINYRAYVLDQYFRANNSPLYGTGQLFVDACDKYQAPGDCTTVAAIAKAETDLCKYHNSATYFNCWGFGGGGPNRIYFDNWQESIDLVTDRLVNAYGISYMLDPSLMEKVFCGSEPGCTNWGNRVKFFMNEINEFPVKNGLGKNLLSYR